MIDLVDVFVGNAQRAFRSYCAEKSDPASYCELLYQTHFYVKETVPVMTAVRAACMDHPLEQQLAAHCEEERGHDQLLLDDIFRLGLSPSGEASPALRKLVELERSAVQHPDPVSALFGHILVMEGYPPTEEDVWGLVSAFGLSLDVAQGFLAHAEADVSHSAAVRLLVYHPSIDRAALLSRALATCRLLGEHWRWMSSKQAHVVH